MNILGLISQLIGIKTLRLTKYIKNVLRNRMRDQWMNDCLVTYIESDVFDSIDNETIMQRYQTMKTRRRIL